MRPVLITDDPDVLDSCLRVAAAVGVEVELVSDVGAARARWSGASLVLVGADAASGLARTSPARRSGVIIVAVQEPDADVWQAAVALGAEHVAVLPDADRWIATRLADMHQGPSRQGLVIGVRGTHGGVGASTLAIGIGLVAARNGHRTLLVDGDSTGGGLDVLLGAENESGLRWPDLMSSRGRIAPAELEGALLHVNGISVLSWDRGPLMEATADAVDAVLSASVRGFDVTVVDLGRALDRRFDAHLRASVLLVAPSVHSVAAAHRFLSTSPGPVDPLHLVVRGSSADADLIAEALGRTPTAVCPDEGDVRRAAIDGEVPAMRRRGSLTAACTEVVHALVPQRQAA